MFTYAYKQPSEYQFSLDSIYFAEFVADYLKTRKDLSSIRFLDLCAGCGVIGLEVSWYRPVLRYIDFVEIQQIYETHFQHNVQLVNRGELHLTWHSLNYETLLEPAWKQKFDFIVSNPPYFEAGHGMLSPSHFKNRCRFFLDSSFQKFLLAMVNSLTEKGEALFLLRPLSQHGKNRLLEVQTFLAPTNYSAKIISQIRGTDIVSIKKSSCP